MERNPYQSPEETDAAKRSLVVGVTRVIVAGFVDGVFIGATIGAVLGFAAVVITTVVPPSLTRGKVGWDLVAFTGVVAFAGTLAGAVVGSIAGPILGLRLLANDHSSMESSLRKCVFTTTALATITSMFGCGFISSSSGPTILHYTVLLVIGIFAGSTGGAIFSRKLGLVIASERVNRLKAKADTDEC